MECIHIHKYTDNRDDAASQVAHERRKGGREATEHTDADRECIIQRHRAHRERETWNTMCASVSKCAGNVKQCSLMYNQGNH